MTHKRRQLLIDRPVQVGLVTRVVFHWFTFLATVIVVLPLFRAIILGDFATPISVRLTHAGIEAAVLLTLFVLLLPYFVYDTFRVTNRFAGPMYRLHQTFKSLAEGVPFRPVNFRKGDFWHDVAQDFNRMVTRLQSDQADANSLVEEAEHAEADEVVTV